MLTLFTTAKPFRGHFNVIQRNALKSWTLLHPEVEIILFGNEEGYEEVARDLGIRHDPGVQKNEFGTILLSSMFERAQAIGKHDLLCYSNCDIVLLGDFRRAAEKVKERLQHFLMVGRRWDTGITEPLDFTNPSWETRLRERALRSGKRRAADWVDYFAFSRGTYGAIPDFAVGRTYWDNWLMWKAIQSGHTVVDVSRVVVAIHQNHDYSNHPGGTAGVWFGAEAKRNLQLLGGVNNVHTISYAQYVLTRKGLKPNWFHKYADAWWKMRRRAKIANIRATIAWQNVIWHPVLNATRPLRTVLGLRKSGAPPAPKV